MKTLALVLSGVLFGTTIAAVLGSTEKQSYELLVQHRSALVALLVLVVLQTLLAWAEKRFAHRAADAAIEDLRGRALSTLAERDPRNIDRALWRTLLSEGIDGLGPYLTGYLPALISTAIATPSALVVVWWLDIGSALIAVVTLPLIPVFMWLVGTLTAGRTERRLADLGELSEQLLDLVTGLPTLRALGRLRTPVSEVRRLSDRHRESTLSVLRIAFLSGMVLEFLATLSIALVAVSIGFRLLDGSMTLAAGLTVLIIIPEVYNPVRQVGARFHDARDGFVAVDQILTLLADADTAAEPDPQPNPGFNSGSDLESTAPSAPTPTTPQTTGPLVQFDGLRAEGRDGPRPREVTGRAQPGQITVLVGPNGAGKSTALLALLGIATDGVTGTALVTTSAGTLTGKGLWERTAFVPQRPVLNATAVGDTSGLSLGQRQRAAIHAELSPLRQSPRRRDLILLDEPTAHLDAAAATEMVDTLRRAAEAGATVLVATHDPLVIHSADHQIEVIA